MEPYDPCKKFSWQRLNEVVTTSGRLLDSDLQSLANMQVRHVIDLAPIEHEGALDDEEAKLARLGIEHTQICVPFNQPREEHYHAFVEALESGPVPVHVHCIYNYRASAFFYRYHIENGMPESDARALMIPHWSPDASEHPAAQPWKAFINAVKDRLDKGQAGAGAGDVDFHGDEMPVFREVG